MANDITTLAIALQSKEAEASMQTFNSLLETGSKNAKNMENMRIGVDVDEALRQLTAFKQSYEDIAKTAQSIHFDLGMNMPAAITPPPVQASGVDVAALEEIKAFFEQSAKEMRRQSEALTESLGKVGTSAETSGVSVRTAGKSMQAAGAAASDYAKKVRELNAAKKTLEKAEAKADAEAISANEAYRKAAEARRELAKAERSLADDRERMQYVGDEYKIRQRLVEKVKELSEAYKKAQAEADRFGKKLYVSSVSADEARAKYEQLKAELAGMRPPLQKAGQSIDTFEQGAKQAGTTVTKLARGFNAVAFAGGMAVPGLSKLGMAISMFAYSGPYVGAAILGLSALTIVIKKFHDKCKAEQQFSKDTGEYVLKLASSTKEFVAESESDWKRLGELSGMESLTNIQNSEAIAIIQRLTNVYGDLGIEIDKATGKLTGYADARERANREDRELQERAMQSALNRAQENYDATILGFGQSSFGDVNLFKAEGGRLLKLLNNKDTPANVIWDEFEKLISETERIKTGQDIVSDYSDFEWIPELKNFRGKSNAAFRGEISRVSADKFSTELKKLKEDFDELSKRKREIEKFNSADVENYSKAVGKLADKIKQAESAFVIEEDGTMRRKTSEETYSEMLAQRRKLVSDMLETESFIKEHGEQAFMDNGKQAGIALKEILLEQAELNGKILDYEKKVSEEKEKQRKAINDAINTEQMRVNTFKSGYITNSKGDLIRSKNTDEIAKDRSEEIKELQALINEKGYGETLEEEKELVAARLKLANLQAEQLKYREQVKSANEKNNDARRYYNFDKNGAVIGKKTEEELNKERQKELEAARARVKASKAGALERAQAQAELDRLAIEDYNARKKTDAAQVVQHAQGVQSRLMRGVQARSTEALALEARSFRRDESEKAILKETKDVNTDIRDTLNNVSETVTRFGEAFINLNGILQPV